jgi:ribosomal protein S18 acetylase RimI-like enzyme
MTIALGTPGVYELDEAVAAVREWQHEAAPMQLHSGDLGWNYRFGTEETAAAIRTWSRDGRILAVGMLDSPTVARQDHRGRGFGTAITIAAAAALREMGPSSARVCTLSSNVGGVAAYKAAGYQAMPEIGDRIRAA